MRYLKNSNHLCLADSAYEQSTSVMTPFQRPQTAAQKSYQYAHVRTRVSVERSLGQWKNQQRALLNKLNVSPEKGCHIIITSACIYNISKLSRAELIRIWEQLTGQNPSHNLNTTRTRIPQPASDNGAEYRTLLANTCFA